MFAAFAVFFLGRNDFHRFWKKCWEIGDVEISRNFDEFCRKIWKENLWFTYRASSRRFWLAARAGPGRQRRPSPRPLTRERHVFLITLAEPHEQRRRTVERCFSIYTSPVRSAKRRSFSHKSDVQMFAIETQVLSGSETKTNTRDTCDACILTFDKFDTLSEFPRTPRIRRTNQIWST